MIFVILLKLIQNIPIVNLCSNRKGVEMEQIKNLYQALGNYAKRDNDNEDSKSVDQVKDELDNLGSVFMDNGKDIILNDSVLWDPDSDDDKSIDSNDFNDIFAQLKDNYGVEVSAETAEMLFSLLDTNHDNVISEDELSFLTRSSGDNKGKITAFSLYREFGSFKSEKADSYLEKQDEKNTDKKLQQYQDRISYLIENSDEIKSPQNAIDYLLQEKSITEEEAQELQDSYYQFQESDSETIIQDYCDKFGCTRSEAIKELIKCNKLTVIKNAQSYK